MGSRNLIGYKKKTLKKYNLDAYHEYDEAVFKEQFNQFKNYLIKKSNLNQDIKSSHIPHMLKQFKHMEEKLDKLSYWISMYSKK